MHRLVRVYDGRIMPKVCYLFAKVRIYYIIHISRYGALSTRALLMSTHNIYFRGEIRKKIVAIPLIWSYEYIILIKLYNSLDIIYSIQ